MINKESLREVRDNIKKANPDDHTMFPFLLARATAVLSPPTVRECIYKALVELLEERLEEAQP